MKYEIGQSVFYPAEGRYGTVRKVINAGDREDIRQQGYRYEVFFRITGWTYSISEKCLRAHS